MTIKTITIKEEYTNTLDGTVYSLIAIAGIKIPKLEEIALALAKEVGCDVVIQHYSGVATTLKYNPKVWTLWERIKFVFTNE